VSFAQLFGGALGIGIFGTVFANTLANDLRRFAPDAPFDLVRHSVDAIWTLPSEQQAGVIHSYVLVSFEEAMRLFCYLWGCVYV
jgi:hypothetical protein